MTVFIQKGDRPMDWRQATKRGARLFDAQLPQWQREQGIFMDSPSYAAWATQWLLDNQINEANNVFNIALAAYRTAVARLAMPLAVEGRDAVTELQPTGEFDPASGDPIMAEVVVSSAVAPVPGFIEVHVFDPETGAQTGTDIVINPIVAADNEARAAAQAVIDTTPDAVSAFASDQGEI